MKPVSKRKKSISLIVEDDFKSAKIEFPAFTSTQLIKQIYQNDLP